MTEDLEYDTSKIEETISSKLHRANPGQDGCNIPVPVLKEVIGMCRENTKLRSEIAKLRRERELLEESNGVMRVSAKRTHEQAEWSQGQVVELRDTRQKLTKITEDIRQNLEKCIDWLCKQFEKVLERPAIKHEDLHHLSSIQDVVEALEVDKRKRIEDCRAFIQETQKKWDEVVNDS